jgi:hypothetical protein
MTSHKFFHPAVFIALLFLIAFSVGCSGADESYYDQAGEPEPTTVMEEPAEEHPSEPAPAEEPLELPTATPEATEQEEEIPPTPELAPGLIDENRRLILEWPPTLRVGDSDVLRLTLEMDDQGNLTPKAEIAGHETRGETVQVPNLYDTHYVFLNADLNIANVDIFPAGERSLPLYPGRATTFYWSLSAASVGDFRGVLSTNLRFVPIEGGAEKQSPLSQQIIEIRGVTLLGLSGTGSRVLGAVGALVGSLLGFDDLLALLKKVLELRKKT